MARQHHKSEPATSQATQPLQCERHYRVGYRPNLGRGVPSPQLILSGRWLAQMGFHSGLPVIVSVEPGRLIVELEFKF